MWVGGEIAFAFSAKSVFILDSLGNVSFIDAMLAKHDRSFLLTDLRERIGSRTYVAGLLGVRLEKLEAYLTGLEAPPRRFVKKLARAARVSPHEVHKLSAA